MNDDFVIPEATFGRGKKGAKRGGKATGAAARVTANDSLAPSRVSSPPPTTTQPATATQPDVPALPVEVPSNTPVETISSPVIDTTMKRGAAAAARRGKKGLNGGAANDRTTSLKLDTSEPVTTPVAANGEAPGNLDGIWTASPALRGTLPTLEPTFSKAANQFVRVTS